MGARTSKFPFTLPLNGIYGVFMQASGRRWVGGWYIFFWQLPLTFIRALSCCSAGCECKTKKSPNKSRIKIQFRVQNLLGAINSKEREINSSASAGACRIRCVGGWVVGRGRCASGLGLRLLALKVLAAQEASPPNAHVWSLCIAHSATFQSYNNTSTINAPPDTNTFA